MKVTKMNFENLKLERVIFSNTLKKRSWYRIEIGDELHTCHRSYLEVIYEFQNECNEELKGIYRNHEIKLTKKQEAWKKHLMQTEYSFFLTIKLPHVNQDGYRRTKIRTEALESYKKLIQELEYSFCGNSNWRRNPLYFIGVLEHGKGGFWHVHIAIPRSDNDLYIADRLCSSITQIINKHNFYKTVIDLRAVHDQEGLCMYMVKELGKKDGESEIFDLRSLFKGIKKDCYIVRLSLRALRLLVKCGLWIKKFLYFNIPQPIIYMKKKLVQKRFNRCSSKINSSPNLDSS